MKIVLFLFFVSNTIASSHIHHHDSEHDHECEVCVIVNNFHSADVPPSAVVIASAAYSFYEVPLEHNYFFKHTLKGYYSTAPPSYLFYL